MDTSSAVSASEATLSGVVAAGGSEVNAPSQLSFFNSFCQLTSAAERVGLVQRHLKVEHYLTNPRSRLWVDFCFNVVVFAVEDAHFNEKQTMALLQLANNTFTYATTPLVSQEPPVCDDSTSKNQADGSTQFASLEATFELFRREMQQLHSHPQGDANATAFSALQLTEIVNFMTSTFFRLFAAYQCAFRQVPVCLDREVALVVETPFPATPLASGTLTEP